MARKKLKLIDKKVSKRSLRKDKRKMTKDSIRRQDAGRKKSAEISKGNKWWERRSKHGLEALFTDPVLLLQESVQYFKDNEKDFISNGKKKIRRPLSLWGLCIQLGVATQWWSDFKRTKTYSSNPDFSSVVGKVEDMIKRDQFDGAAVGLLNSQLISRVIGLPDRVDNTPVDNGTVGIPPINVYSTAPPTSSDESQVDSNRPVKDNGKPKGKKA